jgi:hypothetical protein
MMAKKKQPLMKLNSDPLHLKFTQTSITVTFKNSDYLPISFSIESLIKNYFKTCKSVVKKKQLIYYLKGAQTNPP